MNTLSRIRSHKWFIIILLLAVLLRLYGINWDSGFHFHPDERMLIMVADRIHFFDQLNPDFFNYGSLPVYILKGTSQLLDFVFGTHLATYDGMLWVGRSLSTICDILVLFLIYKITLLLFTKKHIALWSSFFYAVAFFPIQNSHFFIVDTFLNLFATLLIYLLLQYRKHLSFLIIAIGITFAAALTTKVTAIIFLPVILLALIPVSTIRSLLLFTTTMFAFSFFFMPYAYLEHTRFFSDVQQQIQMNGNAYVFPYTLQYINTTPYLYYLKNIFLWGLGPVISLFTLAGIIAGISYFVLRIRNSHHAFHTIYNIHTKKYALFILFYLLYFLVIGRSAVKFMRYMLPLYPFFAIMAGYGTYKASSYKLRVTQKLFSIRYPLSAMSFSLLAFLWTLPFLSIYFTPNTRIQATTWINQFIPTGSTLAVEHWDDRVPIYDPGKYRYEELQLYDIPDDEMKWRMMDEKLARSDYIIIASNRLYTPLQKLSVCRNNDQGRCYPKTSEYYKQLLSNKRGFVKIKEFTSYPRLQIGNWQLRLPDDDADESFTVYDHPKIMIFKKTAI